ncbi:hypothetical protein JG687_00008615 [Phytophthora cactorum]|uniref:Uncharacterized protein n=1 Tax=Phytophthora cactorum TaxID=29920 RepID=A0A8T1UH13_9STRA|nr:hypothetical protein GQ600_19500 [Phytophthora cactorum]KAG6959727.1 hypothetical protein JG687_00008615 [Phytophthora cactorum]
MVVIVQEVTNLLAVKQRHVRPQRQIYLRQRLLPLHKSLPSTWTQLAQNRELQLMELDVRKRQVQLQELDIAVRKH